MAEKILETISDRNTYINQLDKDILETTRVIDNTELECKETKQLVDSIKALGIYPEHEGLIPLSKKLFMKGKIIHTGEYYIHKDAHPDSLVLLKNLDQTIDFLDKSVKLKEQDIEKAKYSQYQLEERKNVLIGKDFPLEGKTDNLPPEIVSDRGVAVKVGDFYEIFEYEN